MTNPASTGLWVRLNPTTRIVNTTTGAAIGETTVGLAGFSGLAVPPFTAAIRVLVQVTSLATGGGAFVTLRDTPGGSDVGLFVSSGVNVPGGGSMLLDFNGGQVTYTGQPGASTSYQVQIWVTGFVRYANG